MRLLGNNVIIEPDDTQLHSDILDMSKTIDGKVCRGIVLLAGPGKINQKDGKRVPMNCKVGDRVRFMDNRNREYIYEGRKCRVLKDDDVVGTY